MKLLNDPTTAKLAAYVGEHIETASDMLADHRIEDAYAFILQAQGAVHYWMMLHESRLKKLSNGAMAEIEVAIDYDGLIRVRDQAYGQLAMEVRVCQ